MSDDNTERPRGPQGARRDGPRREGSRAGERPARPAGKTYGTKTFAKKSFGDKRAGPPGRGGGDKPFRKPGADRTRDGNAPDKPRFRGIMEPQAPDRHAFRAPEPETGRKKPETTITDKERIAKVMARAGVCSRRDAEAMIEQGRVTLNGRVLRSAAINVGEDDEITVDGKRLPRKERTRLWLYHKPAKLMTTAFDPEGRPTVFDALPTSLPRVVTVGRLDYNTEGLLLLTNDGGLARIIAHPDTAWLRRYRVRAHGTITQPELDRLRDGITIDGIDYEPIVATLDRAQGSNTWMTLDLREGKNREVKRVLEHIGLDVNRLIRVSFGPFQLGDLPEGAVEEVRTRHLKEQLGERLAQEANVDFDGAADMNADLDSEDDMARSGDDRPTRPGLRTGTKSEARGPKGRVLNDQTEGDFTGFEWSLAADESTSEKRIAVATTQDAKGRDVRVERITTAPAASKSAQRPVKRDRDDAPPRPARDEATRRESAREDFAREEPGDDSAKSMHPIKYHDEDDAPPTAVPVRYHDDAPGEQAAPAEPTMDGAIKYHDEVPDRGTGRGPRPSERPYAGRPERGERPSYQRPERTERPYAGRNDRSERPQGSRPERSERPYGARPERSERPYGARPERSERPYGARPERSERPRGGPDDRAQRVGSGKPFREPYRERTFRKPAEDGAPRERSERPERASRSYAGKPAGGRSSGDRPFRDRPSGDRPDRGRPGAGERPSRPYHRERTGEERPAPRSERGDGASERPRSRPYSDKPSGDRPNGNRPHAERGARPYQGRAQGDRPQGDRPPGRFEGRGEGRPGARSEGRSDGRTGGRPGGFKPRGEAKGGPRGRPGGDGSRDAPFRGRPPRSGGDRPGPGGSRTRDGAPGSEGPRSGGSRDGSPRGPRKPRD